MSNVYCHPNKPNPPSCDCSQILSYPLTHSSKNTNFSNYRRFPPICYALATWSGGSNCPGPKLIGSNWSTVMTTYLPSTSYMRTGICGYEIVYQQREHLYGFESKWTAWKPEES